MDGAETPRAGRGDAKRRLARRLLAACAALAALGLAGERAVERISLERLRGRLEHALTKGLGREVRIGGALHLELLPRVRFEARDVTVAGAPGGGAPELLRVDSLRLALALAPLLERRVELEELDVAGAELQLARDADGRFAGLPELGSQTEGDESFRIRPRSVSLHDVRVAVSDEATGALTTLALDAFDLTTPEGREPLDWSARGQLAGSPFDLEGRGGSLDALLDPHVPWPVSVRGSVSGAALSLEGSLESLAPLERVDLDVALRLPDLGRLYAEDDPRLPRLGAARLTAHLADPDGVLGLDRIALETEDPSDLRLSVRGRVARLAERAGIELDAELASDRLRLLEPLLERSLPSGSLAAKLHLSDAGGALGASGEAHARSDDGALALDASGSFADLRAREGLDLRVALVAPGLDALAKAAGLGLELPAVGPVRAKGRLQRARGALGLTELDAQAGSERATWLRLSGGVADLDALRGIALDATFGARSFAELGRALRREPAWPDVGPLRGVARLRDPRGTLGVERFELSGGTPGVLSVAVTGRIQDLRQIDALAVEAKLDARDLAVLGPLVGRELPARGPLRFEGRVEGSNEQVTSQGSATLGGTRLDGTWTGSFPLGGRPRVDASLRSELVRLEDFGLAEPDGARDASSAPSHPAPWRDAEPLPFDALRALDGRLVLNAARLTGGRGFDARDAHVDVALEDGALDVRDFGVAYQGGRVTGRLAADARPSPPRASLRVEAQGLDLAGVSEAFELGGAMGSGSLDLAADLRAQGRSPDALLAALDGSAAVALRGWTASSDYASRFLLNLRRTFLGRAAPKADPIGCLLAALRFERGIGRVERLVLDGSMAVVEGSGRLDFARDRWDLQLVPTLRDPGLLTVAGAVSVKGPLDEPRFAPMPLDLATSALRGVVRDVLSPAKAATSGAQRVLGPLGRIFDPLAGAIDMAGGNASRQRVACVLPGAPQGASTSSTESSPGTPSRSGKP